MCDSNFSVCDSNYSVCNVAWGIVWGSNFSVHKYGMGGGDLSNSNYSVRNVVWRSCCMHVVIGCPLYMYIQKFHACILVVATVMWQ